MTTALTQQQRHIVTVIWGTYAFYYLGRLNFSPAIPALSKQLGLSYGDVGLLGTVFFWVYTLGQIINGELGNRLKPRYIVAIGLLLVAITNILFSLQTTLWAMLILWGINGFAQSTGWAPMMRILATRLGSDQRQRISTFFPMSFQVGNAVTWAIAGLLVFWGGWQMAFWLPGIIMLGVLAWWWLADTETHSSERDIPAPPKWRDTLQEWRQLGIVLFAAASIGFIHTGMAIWLPTYIEESLLFPEALIGVVAGMIALLGVVGMWMSGWMLTSLKDLRHVLTIATVALAIVLAISSLLSTWFQLLMVVFAVIVASGLAGLMVGSMPIALAKKDRVSSASGVLTAVFGLGGGLAGVMVGELLDIGSWSTVFAVWAGCSVLALLLVQTIKSTNEVST